MVGYSDNHTRYTYKLYNPEIKRVIMTRDVKWTDWKMTNPADTLKMFRKEDKYYLVPGIGKDTISMSKTEENMHMHVIPDEGERVRKNETYEKSSELMHLKKDADKDR